MTVQDLNLHIRASQKTLCLGLKLHWAQRRTSERQDEAGNSLLASYGDRWKSVRLMYCLTRCRALEIYLCFGKNYKILIAIASKSYSNLTAACNRTDRLQEAGSRLLPRYSASISIFVFYPMSVPVSRWPTWTPVFCKRAVISGNADLEKSENKEKPTRYNVAAKKCLLL